jgi:putative transport protein
LVAGHLGYAVGSGGQNVGFIIFIYCVGVQAGPDFLSAFKQDGLKYGTLALVVGVTGTILAVGASWLFDFEFGMAAGILGGALTSTPTLVAAQDAIQQGAALPDGVTATEALSNMTSSYAITYVFGMAGLILFISFLPKLLRVDVVAEAREYGKEQRLAGGAGSSEALDSPVQPTTRAYLVEKEGVIGLGTKDLTDEVWLIPGMIQRFKRGEESFVPDEETELELGDIVSIVGLEDAHAWARKNFGPEVVDHDVVDRSTESRRILVAKKEVAGRTVDEMDFRRAYNCNLTQVIRTGKPLPRRPDLQLHLGDVLLFTGPRSELDRVAEDLGFEQKRLQETDLVAFAFGIGLGLVLGSFAITIGGTAVSLGTAGGVLLAGLIMGSLHARRPDLANFPPGARNVLTELGLLFFMTGVAVSAGTTIVETFMASGWQLAVAGIVVTLVPVLVAWSVGRYGFKMNSAILMGAITGSMTSTAALKQVQEQAQSQIPMLGYVGAYAFANVLLALAGALIVRV